jgi:hypothetical protein
MERTYLVMTFDVTGLPDEEVDRLAFEAAVQSETSDDYTEGEEGHRGVPEPTSLVLTSSHEPPVVLPHGCDFIAEDHLTCVSVWAGTATLITREHRHDMWPPPADLPLAKHDVARYLR